MKLLLVSILFVSAILTGCGTTMKTYTFKKDRVDQEIEGNRGYLMGTPPPAPVVREVPKRTLIGVDIELPVFPGEEEELPPKEKVVYEEEKETFLKEEILPEEEREPERVEKEEEEWIK